MCRRASACLLADGCGGGAAGIATACAGSTDVVAGAGDAAAGGAAWAGAAAGGAAWAGTAGAADGAAGGTAGGAAGAAAGGGVGNGGTKGRAWADGASADTPNAANVMLIQKRHVFILASPIHAPAIRETLFRSSISIRGSPRRRTPAPRSCCAGRRLRTAIAARPAARRSALSHAARALKAESA